MPVIVFNLNHIVFFYNYLKSKLNSTWKLLKENILKSLKFLDTLVLAWHTKVLNILRKTWVIVLTCKRALIEKDIL